VRVFVQPAWPVGERVMSHECGKMANATIDERGSESAIFGVWRPMLVNQESGGRRRIG
jgi:hypothetical protein